MATGSSTSWVRIIVALIVVGLVLGGAITAAALPRIRQQKELDEAATQRAEAVPRVSVATARLAPPTGDLTLPGDAQGYRDTSLYARTNGYIIDWKVDIGDRVKEGDLLASISAPDVDDQLAQSKANLMLSEANLKVSEANLELANITLKRDIAAGTAQSQQVVDQDKALVKTSEAQVKSAQASIEVNKATVKQYEDLKSFQRIIAPFRGTITARSVELGTLVTADNPSETRPIYHMTQTDKLRVFVNVPQVYSTGVAIGQKTVVYREEDPERKFEGIVTRTANSLDSNTRTLLTQVDVENKEELLRPGMYLQVKFVLPRTAHTVMAPSAALVWRPDATVIGVVDGDNRLHYRKVLTGRDFGIDVEVISGLSGNETVVVHPGDAIQEGQQVEPVRPQSQ
jgi:RND family efflux transporter MFP subunit